MQSTKVLLTAAVLLVTAGMPHAGASECGSALVGALQNTTRP